jgi:hypothetical protein
VSEIERFQRRSHVESSKLEAELLYDTQFASRSRYPISKRLDGTQVAAQSDDITGIDFQ